MVAIFKHGFCHALGGWEVGHSWEVWVLSWVGAWPHRWWDSSDRVWTDQACTTPLSEFLTQRPALQGRESSVGYRGRKRNECLRYSSKASVTRWRGLFVSSDRGRSVTLHGSSWSPVLLKIPSSRFLLSLVSGEESGLGSGPPDVPGLQSSAVTSASVLCNGDWLVLKWSTQVAV